MCPLEITPCRGNTSKIGNDKVVICTNPHSPTPSSGIGCRQLIVRAPFGSLVALLRELAVPRSLYAFHGCQDGHAPSLSIACFLKTLKIFLLRHLVHVFVRLAVAARSPKLGSPLTVVSCHSFDFATVSCCYLLSVVLDP